MNASSRRYLSAWLRRLPTNRIAKRLVAPPDALVIAAPVKGALRLSAVNDAAESLGLRAGMALADARAMYPKIAVADADEQADFALLESIADWCDRYTPLVGLDPPDGLMLDISGCAHLFGGESALVNDLVRRLSAQGFQMRAAVADTVGCAWAMARFFQSLPQRERVVGEADRVGPSAHNETPPGPLRAPPSPFRGGIGAIIVSGEEREALSPLPLAALRLPSDIIAALAQVGLKHISDVVDLPRAPLAARFGASFVHRLDQALGRADEPITPRLPVPAAIVEQRFADPIALERDVLGTIEKLAEKLGALLERRGEGARLLQVAMFRTDGKVFRIEVGTSAPLRESARIRHLFDDRLGVIGDEIDPGFGYDMLRLAALVTEQSEPVQTGLAAPDHAVDLAHLIDRLGARFGLRRVARFVEHDTHIPEFAVMAVNAHMASAGVTRSRGFFREPEQDSLFPTRPVRLLARPEPIDAIAELPDGPPVQFTWRDMRHTVIRAEGPERIAMQWWRNEAGKTLMRDYFRIESQDGLRVWIYRAWPEPHKLPDEEPALDQGEDWYLGQKLNQQEISWFLHGLFS
jgi:protein ImuB